MIYAILILLVAIVVLLALINAKLKSLLKRPDDQYLRLKTKDIADGIQSLYKAVDIISTQIEGIGRLIDERTKKDKDLSPPSLFP